MQKVVSIIKESVKNPANVAVRYGGEEVSVILPNTDTQGTVHFADEICTR